MPRPRACARAQRHERSSTGLVGCSSLLGRTAQCCTASRSWSASSAKRSHHLFKDTRQYHKHEAAQCPRGSSTKASTPLRAFEMWPVAFDRTVHGRLRSSHEHARKRAWLMSRVPQQPLFTDGETKKRQTGQDEACQANDVQELHHTFGHLHMLPRSANGQGRKLSRNLADGTVYPSSRVLTAASHGRPNMAAVERRAKSSCCNRELGSCGPSSTKERPHRRNE